MLWLPFFFYYEILQRNYREITISWSFSYNFFVKLALYTAATAFFLLVFREFLTCLHHIRFEYITNMTRDLSKVKTKVSNTSYVYRLCPIKSSVLSLLNEKCFTHHAHKLLVSEIVKHTSSQAFVYKQ